MLRTHVMHQLLLLVAVVSTIAPSGVEARGLSAASSPLAPQAVSASISLRQGWNLVASPVIPDDPAPAAVFASIADVLDLVYAYEGCDRADPWKKYDPKAPPITNDLTAIGATRGLWIKTHADATWIVTGTSPIQMSILLCAGENLIGYPSSGDMALLVALDDIAGKFDRVYSFVAADTADPWKIHDPLAPSFANDLESIGPMRGYWVEMAESAILTVSTATGTVRRVNAPYFDTDVRYSEMAVFWFGQITPTENYADVRVGYTPNQLVLNVAAFDRRLWYDTTPSAGDLTAWDAVTVRVELDEGPGGALSADAYRFVGQLTWWEDPRTPWQAAYRFDGTAWVAASLPFVSYAGWRGDVPNTNEDDRGWNISFGIPFSSLGLTGPPAPGAQWRLAIVLHDRDDAAGAPIADKTWPESVALDWPATWGVLNFGLPDYASSAPPTGAVTIRHGLNGAVVSDVAAGGYAVCGAGRDYWTEWGNTNEAYYSVDHDRFNVQNQSDISDWPCFSKYYVSFPLSSIPVGKTIVSATLTLHQIGNAGEGWTPGPQPSFIQVLTVDRGWDEASLTWNNAPLARENITGAWVDPLSAFPGWPGVPRHWNVSRAAAQAYATGLPLQLALYSADGPYHSGRYFTSSDMEEWNAVGRPTLTIAWGESR